MTLDRPSVLGAVIDADTRCRHYAGELDVIAIKFACCGSFYPCHLCHAEYADHAARPWPSDAAEERAVLCGPCGHLLRISEYRLVDRCPRCAAAFNPRCALHHHLYFDVAADFAG